MKGRLERCEDLGKGAEVGGRDGSREDEEGCEEVDPDLDRHGDLIEPRYIEPSEGKDWNRPKDMCEKRREQK